MSGRDAGRSTNCREAVLSAFGDLERRTGRHAFRLQEIVDEVMSLTRRYALTTVRTQVSSVMCANAPVHHANHTDDLERVRHGWYRRLAPRPAARRTPAHREPEALPISKDADWRWEGSIQAAFATYLVKTGWTIESLADTAMREQGADIVARQGPVRLIAEVKGYPSTRYARGPKRGEPKPTNPATQARHWYAGALLTVCLARDAHPRDRVALVLPDVGTYQSLVRRTVSTLTASRIEVYLVQESGAVEEIPTRA